MGKINYAGYRFPPEIHFGPMIAAHLRQRRPKPHPTWHLDKVYLTIDSRMVYHWRAVDAHRRSCLPTRRPRQCWIRGAGALKLWAYARDDRPWGRSDPPAVAYLHAPDRKASQPIAHLSGFNGVLQVDGYSGYRALVAKGEVSLAFCWARVRRRFYELAIGGAAPIASEALQRIAALYRNENYIRGGGPEQWRDVRQARTRPLIVRDHNRARFPSIAREARFA